MTLVAVATEAKGKEVKVETKLIKVCCHIPMYLDFLTTYVLDSYEWMKSQKKVFFDKYTLEFLLAPPLVHNRH